MSSDFSLVQSLALSVSATIYDATKPKYAVSLENDTGLKKIGPSFLFYPLFYPLLALVALVETVVRIPLTLIGKMLIFFVPRPQGEDLDKQDTWSCLTLIECGLMAGPLEGMRVVLGSIKQLCKQFGADEAAKSVSKAKNAFMKSIYDRTVAVLIQPRINTVFAQSQTPPPTEITIEELQ